MYITPKQRRKSFWTTLILLFGLPLTVIAGIMAYQYYSGASGDQTPQNVVITNLTSNSVSVTWTTDTVSSGSITTNAGKGDSTPFIDIRGTDRRKTHHVDVVDLDPAKDYTFVILSNEQRYTDEKGKAFKFRTSPVTVETPVPMPVYGSIEGTDKEDAIVYITVDGQSKVYPASSATTSTGKWIVDLSALRDPASRELVKVDKNTLITITVKGTDTLGGTISGTYGDLVDAEGQLKTVVQLNDVPTDTLFAQIPTTAQISSISKATNKPTPTPPVDDGNTDNGGTDNGNNDGGGNIVSDVTWGILKGTQVSASSSSAVIGEDSVKITNITDTGFNVVWLTTNATEGQIKYGTVATDLSETGLDERDSAVSKGKFTSHSVKLARLLPKTKYYFEIYNDLSVIKDNGSPFSVTTFDTLSTPPEFKTVTGKVSNITDLADAVVVVKLTDTDSKGTSGVSSLSSTLPDANGNWVVTIGDIRNATGTEYYSYSETDKLVTDVVALTSVKTVTSTTKAAIDTGVTATASSQTNRSIVKIQPLSNYNVYSGAVPTIKKETGGGGSDIPVIEYTPKTAISSPLLITIILGLISIFVGSGIYIKSQRKYIEKQTKEKMISSVI